jgi:hypothetical protein
MSTFEKMKALKELLGDNVPTQQSGSRAFLSSL